MAERFERDHAAFEGWQSDDELSTDPFGRILRLEGSTMSPDDFAPDSKTEPCSSLVAGAGFIEADETLEDDLPVLGPYPESVVGDPQDHALARCLAELDGDVVVGMADRILEQISDDSSKLVGVASYLGRRHMGRVDQL